MNKEEFQEGHVCERFCLNSRCEGYLLILQ